MTTLPEARKILLNKGWLSTQPPPFQDALLAGAVLKTYSAGQTIFRVGDPTGGIYGLVSGAAWVNLAPPQAPPRLMHVGMPGDWTGEAGFLNRQPRRIGLIALGKTRTVYVPLQHLDDLAQEDPLVYRYIAAMMMHNLDILIRAYYDRHELSERHRLAATLLRLPDRHDFPLPISQAELGLMANVSRNVVNATLSEFARRGWIAKGYRAITLLDRTGLAAFVAHEYD